MDHLWDAGSLDVQLHHDLFHGVCATGEGMLIVKWPFSVLKNDDHGWRCINAWAAGGLP